MRTLFGKEKRNKLFKRRKAVIEVGFSWIFILIAGVVILGLFTYITVKQGNFFKTVINANLLTDLNAIFIGAQVSKNTAAQFNIPETTLTFDCQSYGIEQGLGNDINHDLLGRFIFAPDRLKTSELITWSKPWSLGFRITNFLYITSPYIKYYIVYNPSDIDDAPFALDIYNDLPTQIQKELVPIGGAAMIENQNYDKVIVLVLGSQYEGTDLPSSVYKESDFSKYDDDDVIFVHAIPTVSGEYYLSDEVTVSVDIVYKDKNQDIQDFSEFNAGVTKQGIYDLAALYGAFISGNQHVFQCMMDKAYIKARDVVEIYEERTNNLNQNYPYAVCQGHYGTYALPEFADMSSNLWYQNGNVVTVRISNIANNIRNFDLYNKNLERASCPLLY